MTDKCRRRMNGRDEYITTKITLKEGGEGGRPRRRKRHRERREAPGMREEMGIPVLRRGNPSPWNVGPSDSVYFSPPKQAVASSEPNFWTHSLQIHCNGLSPKTAALE